jgi:hypothetical protein
MTSLPRHAVSVLLIVAMFVGFLGVAGTSITGSSASGVSVEAGQHPMDTPLVVSITSGGESFPDGCPNPPIAVQFYSDPSGGTSPYGYSWSFGDKSSNSTSANPVHDYAAYGMYNLSLEVKDSQGSTAYANVTWDVGQATCTTGAPSNWGALYVVLGLLLIAAIVVATGLVLYRRRRIRGT